MYRRLTRALETLRYAAFTSARGNTRDHNAHLVEDALFDQEGEDSLKEFKLESLPMTMRFDASAFSEVLVFMYYL